jgi:hypothetical protein
MELTLALSASEATTRLHERPQRTFGGSEPN